MRLKQTLKCPFGLLFIIISLLLTCCAEHLHLFSLSVTGLLMGGISSLSLVYSPFFPWPWWNDLVGSCLLSSRSFILFSASVIPLYFIIITIKHLHICTKYLHWVNQTMLKFNIYHLSLTFTVALWNFTGEGINSIGVSLNVITAHHIRSITLLL